MALPKLPIEVSSFHQFCRFQGCTTLGFNCHQPASWLAGIPMPCFYECIHQRVPLKIHETSPCFHIRKQLNQLPGVSTSYADPMKFPVGMSKFGAWSRCGHVRPWMPWQFKPGAVGSLEKTDGFSRPIINSQPLINHN